MGLFSLVLAVGSGGASQALDNATLTIILELAPDATPPPTGKARLTVTAVLSRLAEPETFHVDVPVPGERTLELPAAGAWSVAVEAAGSWARERVVLVERGGARAAITLLPTGTLAGRLEVGKGSEPPVAVSVRFEAEGADGELASASCPVAAGELRCTLPRGTFDLRLGLPGHAPQYLWAVEVPAGGTTRVTLRPFVPGGSISGWVVLEPPPLASTAVTIEASAATAGPVHDATDHHRRSRQTTSATADARGHFQLTGLPAGEVILSARAAGLGEEVAGPFPVYAGAETELPEPMRLRPPARFEVVLDPPVDPYGEAWRLRLVPLARPGGNLARAWSGTAGADGGWSQDGVNEGHYVLEVRSSTAEWLTEQVEVRAGQPMHEIAVPLLEVEGRLTFQAEPRPVALWFVEPGSRKRAKMELEGARFSGWLPREGFWQVVLVDRASGRRFGLAPVEVRPAAGGTKARLELDVPDGRILGRVLDPDGEPLAGVPVEAGPMGSRLASSTSVSDEKGRFNFELLAPGAYLLFAEQAELTGASAQVQLQQGLEPGEVVLQLSRRRGLELQVVSRGEPVPGAHVQALQLVPGLATYEVPEATTDLEGRARLEVAANAAALGVLVFAPGQAARFVALDAAAKHAVLEVDQVGGTLTVTFPPTPPAGTGHQLLPYLRTGAFELSLASFQRWARSRDEWQPAAGHLSVPALAAGEYLVCLPKVSFTEGPPASAHAPDCRQVFVPPGGQAAVTFGPA